MPNRRQDDERIEEMLDKLNSIGNDVTDIKLGMYGDEKNGLIGLVHKTKVNEEDIKMLKSFKHSLCIAAGIISIIFTFITNIILSLFKG